LGQKVHPIGFRIGIINDWRSKWYASKHYTKFVQQDIHIRKAIQASNSEAGISKIDLERRASEVIVTIYTARPGIVIGRGGQRVDELRRSLENIAGERVQLNIREIREPELDAYLVAKSIAGQLEHQIAHRRAMKRTIARTMQAGAKGIKIICSGRLGGAEIARTETLREGRVPLHTLRADIDYGVTEACTRMGRIGVKVWIYKGDILPQLEELGMGVPPPAAEVTGEVAGKEGGEPVEGEPSNKLQIEVAGDVTTEASKVSENT
jgi:small subunit ribosomal protein S3